MRKRSLFFNLPTIILAFSILTPAVALPQKAILQGKVTDSESGEILAGANVLVVSETVRTGAATRSNGEFQITNLAPGNYRITVSYIGYKEDSRDVVLAADRTEILELSLRATDILANPVIVTASRRSEKLLEAPASITVLEAREIEARPALTASEHLKALPAVDFVQPGLNQSRVVIRGFNMSFSGRLYFLVDNRIAGLPSLRANVYQMIANNNEDVERMEVVSGPASALYGPNSSDGVLHMLTKSPFGSEGTTVSFAGGEQKVLMGSLRHADRLGNKVGYKISAQYYQGRDWEYTDPVEQQAREDAIAAGADPDTLKIGLRDFDVEKLAMDIRFDFQFNPDLGLILNGGFNRSSNLELTSIGTGQTIDWTYPYAQARLIYKELFLQAFLNMSNAGDTYVLRTGEPIVDNSKMFVAQAQHATRFGDWQRFTYGLDMLLTRPDTDGTINGGYETRDDMNEFGVYLQSETGLGSKFDLVLAARVDDNNVIEGAPFSPRAALVFKPTPTNNFRVTYNRAFSTPATTTLFIDIPVRNDVFGLGRLLNPVLGFSPGTDIRYQAVNPFNGLHFSRNANSQPQFRSPFASLDPRGITTASYIDLHDPVFTNVMWGIGRNGVLASFVPQFQALLAQQGLSQQQIAAITQAFVAIVPQQVSNVQNVMRTLDLNTSSFTQVDDVTDAKALGITRNETVEFGYKGVLANKLALGLDVYHTKETGRTSPLFVTTPNVFLDPTTLAASVGQQFGAALTDPANAQLAAILQAFDDPARGGNGNGTSADELTRLFIAGTNNNGAAFIPFGTVSPKEAFDPTAVVLARRNFGSISYSGVDMSLTYYADQNWTFGGNYSYLSENLFKDVDGVDVAANAPRHKFGANLGYRQDRVGFDSQLRFRWVEGFPLQSDVYVGDVDAYHVLDLIANYRLPFSSGTTLTLAIQNLTNNKHKEWVDVPDIERLAMLRVRQAF